MTNNQLEKHQIGFGLIHMEIEPDFGDIINFLSVPANLAL